MRTYTAVLSQQIHTIAYEYLAIMDHRHYSCGSISEHLYLSFSRELGINSR